MYEILLILIIILSILYTIDNKPLNIVIDFILIIINLSILLFYIDILDISFFSFILIIIYASALAILFGLIMMLFNNIQLKSFTTPWHVSVALQSKVQSQELSKFLLPMHVGYQSGSYFIKGDLQNFIIPIRSYRSFNPNFRIYLDKIKNIYSFTSFLKAIIFPTIALPYNGKSTSSAGEGMVPIQVKSEHLQLCRNIRKNIYISFSYSLIKYIFIFFILILFIYSIYKLEILRYFNISFTTVIKLEDTTFLINDNSISYTPLKGNVGTLPMNGKGHQEISWSYPESLSLTGNYQKLSSNINTQNVLSNLEIKLGGYSALGGNLDIINIIFLEIYSKNYINIIIIIITLLISLIGIIFLLI